MIDAAELCSLIPVDFHARSEGLEEELVQLFCCEVV